jgi:hypothetical protein
MQIKKTVTTTGLQSFREGADGARSADLWTNLCCGTTCISISFVRTSSYHAQLCQMKLQKDWWVVAGWLAEGAIICKSLI